MPTRVPSIAASILLALLQPRVAFASSPIIEHLAGVEAVNVKVIVSSTDPIFGLPRARIREEIELLVKDLLKRNEIAVTCSSAQAMRVYLRYEDHTAQKPQTTIGNIAFSVRLELREQARLVRDWSSSEESTVHVSTWRESRLVLAAPENAYDQLFEAIEILATRFAEETLSARQYRARLAGAQRE